MANIFGLEEGTNLKLFLDQAISTTRTIVFVAGGSLITLGVINDEQLQKYGSIAAIVITLGWLFYKNWRAKQKTLATLQTGGLAQAQATGTPLTPLLADPKRIEESLTSNASGTLSIASKPTPLSTKGPMA